MQSIRHHCIDAVEVQPGERLYLLRGCDQLQRADSPAMHRHITHYCTDTATLNDN